MAKGAAKLASSRKGKKAWRRNVDVGDVEAGVEELRERKRLYGDDDDGEDFVIDIEPLAAVPEEKKLKATEILQNKLKVPALVNPRAAHNKRAKTAKTVKKTDYLHLVKMNGGRYGEEDRRKARMDKDGLYQTTTDGDLWDATPVKDDTPDFLKEKLTMRVTAPKRRPDTIVRKPIMLQENELTEGTVHAGKSYNPTVELWKELINQEFDTEAKKEAIRQRLEEFKEKLALLAADLKKGQWEDDLDDDDEPVEEEDEEETSDYKLSANPAVKNQKKTKYKRNKEARHKQRVAVELEIKEIKARMKQLQEMDLLEVAPAPEPLHKGKDKKVFRLFKYTPVQAPLEVKLLDELTSTMRQVKPEGNLLYDLMLKLQLTGKVETRIPVAKKRKYAQKFTEKWSFKDFK